MEMNDVAVLVAEDLDFYVLGSFDVALEKNGRVSEGVLGLFLGLRETALQLGWFFHDPHSASAAAEGRFNDERESDFVGDGKRFIGIRNRVIGARKNGDFGRDGLGAGSGFVSHRAKEVGGRSDESDAFAGAGAGEIGIFRKKSVSRVN